MKRYIDAMNEIESTDTFRRAVENSLPEGGVTVGAADSGAASTRPHAAGSPLDRPYYSPAPPAAPPRRRRALGVTTAVAAVAAAVALLAWPLMGTLRGANDGTPSAGSATAAALRRLAEKESLEHTYDVGSGWLCVEEGPAAVVSRYAYDGTRQWATPVSQGYSASYIYSFTPTADGGCVMIVGSGENRFLYAGDALSRITKLNADGAMVWSRSSEGLRYVFERADGGLMAVGADHVETGDLFAARLDGDGNVEKSVYMGGSDPDYLYGASYADGLGLAILAQSSGTDGGFGPASGENGGNGLTVALISDELELEWSTWDHTDGLLWKIQARSDAIYLRQYAFMAPNSVKPASRLVKLKPDGTQAWSRSFGDMDQMAPADGDYIVGVLEQESGLLRLITPEGETGRTLEGVDERHVGRILTAADGELVVAASGYEFPAEHTEGSKAADVARGYGGGAEPAWQVSRDVTAAVEARLYADRRLEEFLAAAREAGISLDHGYDDAEGAENFARVWYAVPAGLDEFPAVYSHMPSGAAYVYYRGEITRLKGHDGGYVAQAMLNDLNGDGTPELVYMYSWGSGLHHNGIGVVDLASGQVLPVALTEHELYAALFVNCAITLGESRGETVIYRWEWRDSFTATDGHSERVGRIVFRDGGYAFVSEEGAAAETSAEPTPETTATTPASGEAPSGDLLDVLRDPYHIYNTIGYEQMHALFLTLDSLDSVLEYVCEFAGYSQYYSDIHYDEFCIMVMIADADEMEHTGDGVLYYYINENYTAAVMQLQVYDSATGDKTVLAEKPLNVSYTARDLEFKRWQLIDPGKIISAARL